MRSWAEWLFGSPPEPPPAAEAEVVEPDELMCPISQCLYRDPVMLVSGHTFEKTSVMEFWRRRPLVNPLGTGERLKSAQMIVNYGCRSQVDSWLERHPGYTPEGWTERSVQPRSTQAVREGLGDIEGRVGRGNEGSL